MLDPASVPFLEGGCALIVGTVAPDGQPVVTRGWGLTVLGTEPPTVRLLLAVDDTGPLDLMRGGSLVACTGTDVATLHSQQLKGRCVGVDAATDEDRVRASRYIDAFFHDVMRVDMHAQKALDRLIPTDYVAATLTVEDVFNQTPGPAAGTRMALL